MITKIHIENFKGIGSPGIDIELKPITLLFGANSAGKSTVLQALQYVREILLRENLDPENTETGGSAIDLGGFKNIVNGQDLNKTIKLKLEIDLKKSDFFDFYYDDAEYMGVEDSPLEVFFDQLRDAGSASVEMELKWSEQFEIPYISAIDLYYESQFMLRIDSTGFAGSSRKYYISDIEFMHPLLSIDKSNSKHSDRLKEILENYNIIDGLYEQTFVLMYNRSRFFMEPLVIDDKFNINIHLPNFKKGLPRTERLFNAFSDFTNQINQHPDYDREIDDIFIEILSVLIQWPFKELRDTLEKLTYIGPIREIPKRNYKPQKFNDISRWSNGLAAWDRLYSFEKNLIEKVDYWLSQEGLDTGYSLVLKKYKKLFLDSKPYGRIIQSSEKDEDLLKKEIEALTTHKEIFLVDNSQGVPLKPYDLGVGISQVLPVMVGALDQKKSILSIEQPELHIHPKIQTELADLFIEQINNKPHIIYLLETHSEHLMLRFLRRIEETTENEVPVEQLRLSPDQLSVYFFEQNGSGTEVTALPIDETGEFTRQWPQGFFEERAEELFR